MTEAERQGRVRTCEQCQRTWIAFGLRGERCVWCRPSIPEDARQLQLDDSGEPEPSARSSARSRGGSMPRDCEVAVLRRVLADEKLPIPRLGSPPVKPA